MHTDTILNIPLRVTTDEPVARRGAARTGQVSALVRAVAVEQRAFVHVVAAQAVRVELVAARTRALVSAVRAARAPLRGAQLLHRAAGLHVRVELSARRERLVRRVRERQQAQLALATLAPLAQLTGALLEPRSARALTVVFVARAHITRPCRLCATDNKI